MFSIKIYNPFWFWLIVGLRLITPLLFFVNSLAGILTFFIMDVLDEQIWSRTSDFKHKKYHLLDKYMDTYGYFLLLVSSLGSQYIFILTLLFVFRLVGTLMFFMTGDETKLILFPNFFEFFWIWAVLLPQIYPALEYKLSVLLLLLVLKIAQEFAIHKYGIYIFPWFKKKLFFVVRWLDFAFKTK